MLGTLKSKVDIQIMKKFNAKEAKSNVVIIQSLEGTPKLLSNKNKKALLVLFKHNQSNQAVKN